MKILILGAGGMLGHRLFFDFQSAHQVWGATRGKPNKKLGRRCFGGVNALDFDSVSQVIERINPEIIVNCVALLNRLSGEEKKPLYSIAVNALFPHRLALYCQLHETRLIHISTDCVFSGKNGNYDEFDFADGDDLYGRTKYLGEVHNQPKCLTLRTSFIGRELKLDGGSLLEWFLRQEGLASGYRLAYFSGLTTTEFSKILIERVIPCYKMQGVFHVSGPRISKYELLFLIKQTFGKKIEIVPNNEVKIDRSLSATRFNNYTGYQPPNWAQMLHEMAY